MVTILTFLSLVVVAWVFAELHKASAIRLHLEARASDLSGIAVETILESVETLRRVSSIVVFSENTSLTQFQNFSRHSVEGDSGLLILEWQPLVPANARAAFVDRARQQRGLPDFALWEPGDDGDPIPARARAEHVPVLYMVSRSKVTDTTGLDLAWSEERMASKWAARDHGHPEPSGFFRIVTNKKAAFSPLGFAITLPVYQDGVVPDSVEERRSRLLGYIAGVYSLEDLLKPLLDIAATEGLNLSLSDGRAGGVALEQNTGPSTSHSRSASMRLYGSEWNLVLTPTRGHVAQHAEPRWYLLPVLFAFLGFLLLFFLWLLQRKSVQLFAAQQRLTDALARVRESEAFLLELARHDPLTGLLNRRAIFEQIGLELDRARRQKSATALLMIDADHFKQINDQLGHPVGDEVLKNLAGVLRSMSRSFDLAARIGGEEFCVLLSHTNTEQAIATAERVRTKIAETDFAGESGGPSLSVTVSIGVAVAHPDSSVDELVARADKALYLAKNWGRNCVKVYT